MLIPSVREILVIHADKIAVELLSRRADGSWPDDFSVVTTTGFTLASIQLEVPVGELYRRSGLSDSA
jgi:hypothetical protein